MRPCLRSVLCAGAIGVDKHVDAYPGIHQHLARPVLLRAALAHELLPLYSRLVVGWERMTATLVCDALRMALFRRQRPRGVIVHSDRGSQYCSHEHHTLLEHCVAPGRQSLS